MITENNKEHEAIRICADKDVNVYLIKFCDNCTEYNRIYGGGITRLSRAEFLLLKDVFCNEKIRI